MSSLCPCSPLWTPAWQKNKRARLQPAPSSLSPSSLSLFSSWWCPVAVWPRCLPRCPSWSSCHSRLWVSVSACVWFWTHPIAQTADPCWKWWMLARRRAEWIRAKWSWWWYGRGSTEWAFPPRPADSRGTWWLARGRWVARRSGPSWWSPSRSPQWRRSHWTPWRRGCRPAEGTWWCRTCPRPQARRPGHCCPGRWGQCQPDPPPPLRYGSPTASHGPMPEGVERMTTRTAKRVNFAPTVWET